MDKIQFFNKVNRKIIQLIKGKNVAYSGNYKTWDEAINACEGYDKKEIFEKVYNACVEVRKGNACYERDSVLFYEKGYNRSLLAYLYKCALENNGILDIVDWGGEV